MDRRGQRMDRLARRMNRRSTWTVHSKSNPVRSTIRAVHSKSKPVRSTTKALRLGHTTVRFTTTPGPSWTGEEKSIDRKGRREELVLLLAAADDKEREQR